MVDRWLSIPRSSSSTSLRNASSWSGMFAPLAPTHEGGNLAALDRAPMNRRGFLACLGLAPVAAVAPLAAEASPAGVGANFLNELLQQMRRAIRGACRPGPAILYGADGVPMRLVYEHSIDCLTGAVTIYDVRSIEMGGEEK